MMHIELEGERPKSRLAVFQELLPRILENNVFGAYHAKRFLSKDAPCFGACVREL
jgi:hypothetical protein